MIYFKNPFPGKSPLWLSIIGATCLLINPLLAMETPATTPSEHLKRHATEDETTAKRKPFSYPSCKPQIPMVPAPNLFSTDSLLQESAHPIKTVSATGLNHTPIVFSVPDIFSTPTPTKPDTFSTPSVKPNDTPAIPKTLYHTKQYYAWQNKDAALTLAQQRHEKLTEKQAIVPTIPDIIRHHTIPQDLDSVLKIEKRIRTGYGVKDEDGIIKFKFPSSSMTIQTTPFKKIITKGTIEIFVAPEKDCIFHDTFVSDGDSKKFQCSTCSICFSTESDCDNHIEKTHIITKSDSPAPKKRIGFFPPEKESI